ncbi:hypothetical protein PMZ80_009015 [Knufia obscura]|uniref:Uncharacterized protein n=1 Tax=Knufia obscura TaxID=1635080 RepID=A0ABR0REZ4_9EURO|nr:hypothetical protein PMZ80_009015 [Knufia obscura]
MYTVEQIRKAVDEGHKYGDVRQQYTITEALARKWPVPAVHCLLCDWPMPEYDPTEVAEQWNFLSQTVTMPCCNRRVHSKCLGRRLEDDVEWITEDARSYGDEWFCDVCADGSVCGQHPTQCSLDHTCEVAVNTSLAYQAIHGVAHEEGEDAEQHPTWYAAEMQEAAELKAERVNVRSWMGRHNPEREAQKIRLQRAIAGYRKQCEKAVRAQGHSPNVPMLDDTRGRKRVRDAQSTTTGKN